MLLQSLYEQLFEIKGFIPEIFLSSSILLFILFRTFRVKIDSQQTTTFLNYQDILFCSFILLLTLFLTLKTGVDSRNPLFHTTEHALTLKAISLGFAILLLGPVGHSLSQQKLYSFEFYVLYLIANLANLLLFSVFSLVSLYLVLELQTLCFYIFSIFRKNSIFSVQAGIRYFIFGSIASAFMLMSFSYIYILCGGLNFWQLHLILGFIVPVSHPSNLNYISCFCIFLVFASLFFKLGVFPLHFWVPEVYEGAPLASTIIFSVLPKIALVDLLLRLKNVFGLRHFGSFFDDAFFLIGLATIFIGSILALRQTRLKLFLIYSSISQMGFPLILLGMDSKDPYIQIYVYFFIVFYSLTSILIWSFYVILYEFSEKRDIVIHDKGFTDVLFLSDLKGLFTRGNYLALFFIVFVFSISGIPPFSGFFIKYSVIYNLIIHNYIFLGVFILFLSLISNFFYIRLAKIGFFEKRNYDIEVFKNFLSTYEPTFYITCFCACFSLLILINLFLFFDSYWLKFVFKTSLVKDFYFY